MFQGYEKKSYPGGESPFTFPGVASTTLLGHRSREKAAEETKNLGNITYGDSDTKETTVSEVTTKVCFVCKKEGVKNKCSGCKTTYYCDVECQKKDWDSVHKTICNK